MNPSGPCMKEDVDGQENACAARNYVYARTSNPAPAAAGSGNVVAAQVFTPRVSGRVRVVGCVSGVMSDVAATLQVTITVGAQLFTTRTCSVASGGGNGANISFETVLTGLVVGTQVPATFTWTATGGTFQPDAGSGSLFVQELPN